MSKKKKLSYYICPSTESHCNILVYVLPDVCASVCVHDVREKEKKKAKRE